MKNISKNKIKVAWLVQSYDEGYSFFAVNSNIMTKLKADNFDWTFAYLEKRSEVPNILEEKGFKVVYFGNFSATKIFNPFVLWRFIKFLKNNSIDILHCHRHKATLYGALAAWITRIPVVYSHVHGLKRTRSALRRMGNRIIYSIVSKVIAVSDAVRKDVMDSNPRLCPDKVIVLRNSIDIEKFSNINTTKQEVREILGLSHGAFIFGTVGRLVPTKGQSYLIDAFAKVRRSVENSHLVFIGNGPLEADLKHQAADLGCLEAITFTGQRSDIPEMLRALDCFILSSLAEGLPLSLLEAMAVSLPCVATAVGGVPEIIVDEKVGYLVSSQDPDALAKSMLDCYYMSEDERRRMGSAASDMVKTRFSNDVYATELSKIYKDELHKKYKFL